MNRASRLAIGFCAALAWIALAAVGLVVLRGGARTPLQYMPVMLKTPLANGATLPYTDRRLAFWSGWGYDVRSDMRPSYSMEPEIAFTRAAAGVDCTLMLAAFPSVGTRQRAFVSLNGGRASEIAIDHDGIWRVPLDGAAVSGVNMLSFRLPDARLAVERLQAVGLRSLTISCRPPPPA